MHIVILPWLALGHLLPFGELAKRIAQHGHRVSFLATPKNISRLPALPPHLSSLVRFVELPVPSIEHLPHGAEASLDLPSDDLRPYLRQAFDSFEHELSALLRRTPTDWILFDYAAYWAPRAAAEFGVPCAFVSLFDAAVLSFLGPPSGLMGGEGARTTPEQFAEPPAWVPFKSTVFYKPYEVRELFKPGALPDASGVSETYRFGKSMQDCQLMAIRSCKEYEEEWFDFLGKLHKQPVIPLGFFPPPPPEAESENRTWSRIRQWLDELNPRSVVYAAFGSEVKLRNSQLQEIALGLEQSELPFVWAARAPAGSDATLPEGFMERTKGRGLVCMEWAPQVRVLRHRSVGGFLTHAGWNSIVEGLAAGHALALLPIMFDQGLNARDLVGRGVGVEVPRREEDGAFTADGIARTLRLVMVEEEGEALRAKAKEYGKVFGDEETNDRRVRQFLEHLEEHRRRRR